MFRVRVRGRYGCFTDKKYGGAERYSYPIITPSAIKGLFNSVYWKPGVNYVTDKIYVLNPIKRYIMMTNELSVKAPTKTFVDCINGDAYVLPHINCRDKKNMQQRTTNLLLDLDYVIEMHIEIDEKKKDPTMNIKKANSMFWRRMTKGQSYRNPCLGLKEFDADLELFPGRVPENMLAYNDRVIDFGNMLYDLDYITDEEGHVVNVEPIFYHSVLDHGVVDLNNCEVFKIVNRRSR